MTRVPPPSPNAPKIGFSAAVRAGEWVHTAGSYLTNVRWIARSLDVPDYGPEMQKVVMASVKDPLGRQPPDEHREERPQHREQEDDHLARRVELAGVDRELKARERGGVDGREDRAVGVELVPRRHDRRGAEREEPHQDHEDVPREQPADDGGPRGVGHAVEREGGLGRGLVEVFGGHGVLGVSGAGPARYLL